MTYAEDDYDDLLEEGVHRWRRRFILLGLASILIIAVALGLWALLFRDGGSAASAVQTAKVQRGAVMKTISTSATAASQSTANLSFGTSGKVTAVNVTVGQQVKQGNVLAEVEATTLQDTVTRAQVSLNSAQTKLNQLLEVPTTSDMASADQSVSQAQANLDKANTALQDLYNPTTDTVNAAQQAVLTAQSQLIKAQQARANVDSSWSDAHDAAAAAVDKAQRALDDARDARDQACDSDVTPTPTASGGKTCDSAENAYEDAKDALQTAKDNLDKLGSGPDSSDIASADLAVQSAQLALQSANDKQAALGNPSADDVSQAQHNVDSAASALTAAESKRDETYAGTKSEDLSAQQDQVRLAQISLTEARNDLEKAQILAPFDGTVAALNVAVGETAGTSSTSSSTSTAAIVLNTPNALVLNLSIGESDLPNVKAGLNGSATFDAITGRIFPIAIDSVGTNATTTQGVVTYQAKAHIVSDATATAAAEPVPGMNASVTIIVDQAQDVLTVPASAIQRDGRDSVVTIQNDDGSTTRQIVTTGLTNGTNTEITDGLEEGQTVIVSTTASTTSTSQTSQTGQTNGFFGGTAGGEPSGGGGIPVIPGGSTR
jgi:HlyD family secretion protein